VATVLFYVLSWYVFIAFVCTPVYWWRLEDRKDAGLYAFLLALRWPVSLTRKLRESQR
jgi:hypothetical protein